MLLLLVLLLLLLLVLVLVLVLVLLLLLLLVLLLLVLLLVLLLLLLVLLLLVLVLLPLLPLLLLLLLLLLLPLLTLDLHLQPSNEVTALRFRPSNGSTNAPMLVSASTDGEFRVFVYGKRLAAAGLEQEEDEDVLAAVPVAFDELSLSSGKNGKKKLKKAFEDGPPRPVVGWISHATGFYREGTVAHSLAFSADGSIMAVSFDQVRIAAPDSACGGACACACASALLVFCARVRAHADLSIRRSPCGTRPRTCCCRPSRTCRNAIACVPCSSWAAAARRS